MLWDDGTVKLREKWQRAVEQNGDNVVQSLFSPVVWGRMKIVSVMASDGKKQTKFLVKPLVRCVPNAGLCCRLVATMRNDTSVQFSRISG